MVEPLPANIFKSLVYAKRKVYKRRRVLFLLQTTNNGLSEGKCSHKIDHIVRIRKYFFLGQGSVQHYGAGRTTGAMYFLKPAEMYTWSAAARFSGRKRF